MYTDQVTVTPDVGLNPVAARFAALSNCPGYVVKVNPAGFQWKQVCSCCEPSPAPYVQVSYNLKV